MKTCKKCGTERADGVIKCPVCTKAYNAAYNADNREERNLKKKAYNAANRENSKAYYVDNREKINLKGKAHHAANREKINLKKKDYRADNREKISLQAKAYNAANKKEAAVYQKAYRAANPEKTIAGKARQTLKRNGIDPAQNKELVNAITKLRFISQLIRLRKNENNRK